MFCPQCGNPVNSQSPDLVTDGSPTEALRPEVPATQPLTAVAPPNPQHAPTQALDHVPHRSAHRVREDGVRGRVEKFVKVSSVMIDQAAYDPSLRFLLVAAVFFLLFLVLLILSKVIG
jgi:hypothetical protein